MQLNGDGPWSIGTDFELIHTPGHTEVRKDFDFQMQTDFAKDKRVDLLRKPDFYCKLNIIFSLNWKVYNSCIKEAIILQTSAK